MLVQRLFALLLLIGSCFVAHAQYDPAFNDFYRSEIDDLRANYENEEIKLELVILYNDWLKDIKKEKAALSDRQAEPVYAQKLGDLGNLEESVINEMTGKKQELKEEPVMEDSTMMAGGMPDSLMSQLPEDTLADTVPYKPDTIDVASLPIKDEPKEEPKVVLEEVVDEEVVEEKPEEKPEEKENFNETTNEEKSSTASASFAELLRSEIPGVYYRVQVFASARPTPGADVAEKVKLIEEVMEEQHNGLYKYLVGKFSVYTSAKEKAEEIKANTGVEAFVVGYKTEARTPLNEIFGY